MVQIYFVYSHFNICYTIDYHFSLSTFNTMARHITTYMETLEDLKF